MLTMSHDGPYDASLHIVITFLLHLSLKSLCLEDEVKLLKTEGPF